MVFSAIGGSDQKALCHDTRSDLLMFMFRVGLSMTIIANEVLMRDDEMVLFVESDFGYSPMLKRKQPATGVRRKVIKQFAPPPDDTPELQEARPVVKLFYLGTMDAGHKVDKLVKARRGRSHCPHDSFLYVSYAK